MSCSHSQTRMFLLTSIKPIMFLFLLCFLIISKPATTMADIKVHGHPLSPNTRRVLAALHEKGLEFDFVHVELKDGEHKKESFISLNPFGQVPAFEDGDLKLFESRAITRYIAHEHSDKGAQLLRPGSKAMAMLSVWLEVEAHQFDPVASKLTWEQVFKPIYGLPTDKTVVEENEAKLAKVLDVYETCLNQTKYLASDSFTLADLHHLPAVQYLLGTSSKMLFDERPKVNAWVSDITARPAWRKAVQLKELDHMECE